LTDLLENFEAAWEIDGRAAIDDFLPHAADKRTAALVALVHVDFEHRLKAGEAVRVDNYLERYPELTSDGRAVAALLPAEYEHRRGREPQLLIGEYIRRFPQYEDELNVRVTTSTPATSPGSDDPYSTTVESIIPPAPPAAPRAFRIRCPHCHNPIQLI